MIESALRVTYLASGSVSWDIPGVVTPVVFQQYDLVESGQVSAGPLPQRDLDWPRGISSPFDEVGLPSWNDFSLSRASEAIVSGCQSGKEGSSSGNGDEELHF